MRIGHLIVAALLLALSSGLAAQNPGQGDAAASVNGSIITNADLEKVLGQNLATLHQQIYDLKRLKLDSMIDEQLIALEAAKRGVTPSALLEREVASHAMPPTDEEIVAFYEANKARLKGDLPSWRDHIRTFLSGQRTKTRREEFLKSLRGQGNVQVFLKAPTPFRSTVSTDGAHSRGSATAPVTLVEFSDFHCPYCRKVQPVLAQLMLRYDGKLRIVYKDMPLDNLHPQARAAAEAARCAGDQDRFWEYHDKLYAGAPDTSLAALNKLAQELGLDIDRFESCRSSRKYQALVQKDVKEGASMGVAGTPGFFINGRFLSGAQPIEAFMRIIDEELATAATR